MLLFWRSLFTSGIPVAWEWYVPDTGWIRTLNRQIFEINRNNSSLYTRAESIYKKNVIAYEKWKKNGVIVRA